MYRVIILSLLVHVDAASLSLFEPHIIGGEQTTIEDHPYQVAIYNGNLFKCGGTLVTTKHVVTAAHCFHETPEQPQFYDVLSGSTSRIGFGIPCEKIVLHPNYEDRKFGWDAAVVTIKRPLQLSPKVQPVSLVAQLKEPKPGEVLTASGWGKISYSPVEMLRAVQIETVDREICQKIYIKVTNITDEMFCAGTKGRGVTVGDSGGPVVNQQNELVGIISFGGQGVPPVHVNVANPQIHSFITENTKQ